MQPEAEHAEIKRLLTQNQELLRENNALLKKLHRGAVWAFWFRLSSYFVIVGMPFALYYYVIEPYMNTMGAPYTQFIEQLNGLPGFSGIDQILKQPK